MRNCTMNSYEMKRDILNFSKKFRKEQIRAHQNL